VNLNKIAILLFAYNRPSHLKRVLVSLEDYKISSDIILIIDGPKDISDKVNQRSILLMTKRFKKKNFKILHRKKNLGLSKSITGGIDFYSKKYEGLIILEDDVVPYKAFFDFVKHFFEQYKRREDTVAMCGYQNKNFNPYKGNKLRSLILKNFTPWGWAISSRKWQEIRKIMKKINFKHSKKIPSFFKKYINSAYYKKKKRDLWTLNFIYTNYINDKYYVYPNFSLVKNVGFDGTGINSKITNIFDVFDRKPLKIEKKSVFILKKKLISKHNNFFKKKIRFFY